MNPSSNLIRGRAPLASLTKIKKEWHCLKKVELNSCKPELSLARLHKLMLGMSWSWALKS